MADHTGWLREKDGYQAIPSNDKPQACAPGEWLAFMWRIASLAMSWMMSSICTPDERLMLPRNLPRTRDLLVADSCGSSKYGAVKQGLLAKYQ